MRKFILSLLLATTAVTPAMAQSSDADDRRSEREERRSERSQARQDRSEARQERRAVRTEAAPQRVERPARTDRVERSAPRVSVQERAVRDRNVRTERRSPNVNERGRPTLEQQRVVRDSAIDARRDRREALRTERQESRDRWVADAGRRVVPPAGARPDRPAPPPEASPSRPAPTWHTGWRRDHRYDWRRWRDRNRTHFRLGVYFDPFGWGYNRYNVGWRLWPSYYSRHYWLDDPWMYRLPYAPWPYKWVRYYDDVLLVNTYSGQVVDVIYDFFW